MEKKENREKEMEFLSSLIDGCMISVCWFCRCLTSQRLNARMHTTKCSASPCLEEVSVKSSHGPRLRILVGDCVPFYVRCAEVATGSSLSNPLEILLPSWSSKRAFIVRQPGYVFDMTSSLHTAHSCFRMRSRK